MLNIRPIGGVGQIGSNMTLVEDTKSSFIIDCGILFPNEDFFDLNYLIPDMSSIEVIPQNIVITHGHEDHIGAIIHLIEKFPNISIHAPLFARELILKKLNYKKMSHKIDLFTEESIITLGNFKVHPIHVNHSIPDTFGLLIKNKEYSSSSILYISDFKIDKNTPYEKEFNFEKIKNLSRETKQRILFADSTNITSKNLQTPSENDVIQGLSEIITKEYSRIFVTTFSSNIHRIQSIINIASDISYKVIPYGRSMNSYIELALNTGHLHDPQKCLKDAKSVNEKDTNIVVLLSGCQGDFRGSLRRVTSGTDGLFRPKESDHFIFSSKAIPGNEKKIYNIINDLAIVGAKVSTDYDSLIHASGHPGRTDLLELYNKYQATDIIPIHGEYDFLRKHFNFIQEQFPQATPYLFSNHDQICISKSQKITNKKEKSPLPPILIHGKGIEIERKSISIRRKMACNGTIFISIKIDSLTKLKAIFDYSFLGLPQSIQDHAENFELLIRSELKDRKITKLDSTAEVLRIAVRRFFNEKLGYKPITIVHFI